MRHKSRLLLFFLTVILIVAMLFTVVACKKKTSDNPEDANYKFSALLPNDSSNVQPGTADDKKSLKTNSFIDPFTAFTKLMQSVNSTRGEVVENFNEILNSEIDTVITVDEGTVNNGVVTSTKKLKKYRVLSQLAIRLDKKLSGKADKSRVKLEIREIEDNGEEVIIAGLYYKEGKLLFASVDPQTKKSLLPPIYVSDIDLNYIYSKASHYGLNNYVKSTIKNLLNNNLKIKAGGNEIPIMELVGPIVFPIIFSTDVQVIDSNNAAQFNEKIDDDTIRYKLTFNAEKFIKAITPLLSRVPDLVKSMLQTDVTKRLPAFVDAILKKVSNNEVNLQKIKNYKIKNFSREFVFDVEKVVGRLKSVKLVGVTPNIAKGNKDSTDSVEIKNIVTNPSNANTVNTSINIVFPEKIREAFDNIDSLPEFSFGKLDLELDFKIHTERDREIALAELLLNSTNIDKTIDTLRDTYKVLFYDLGITDKDPIEMKNDVIGYTKLIRQKYDEKIDSYKDKLDSDDFAVRSDALAKVNKLKKEYNDYNGNEILINILKTLNERKIVIKTGDHGFRLSIKTDIKLNNNIGDSIVAIELTDTSVDKNVLVGLYLLPDKTINNVKYSQVLLDLSGLGLPAVKLGNIDLAQILLAPLEDKLDSIFSEISGKGFIGFIMEKMSSKSGAQTSLAKSIESKELVYDNNTKQLVALDTPSSNHFARALNVAENKETILDAIEDIINDPSTKKLEDDTLNIHISRANLEKVVEQLAKMKNKDARTQITFGFVKNFLINAVDTLDLNLGAKRPQANKQPSYSDYALKFNVRVKFVDTERDNNGIILPSNTVLDLGISKFNAFFELDDDFKSRMREIAESGDKFTDIRDVKSIKLSGSIKLVMKTGSDDSLEVIKFLKKLDPDGIGKKIEAAERNSKDGFSIGFQLEKGFNFAIKLDLSLSVNIKSLKDFGISDSVIQSINSLPALKDALGKVKLEQLLNSIRAEVKVYTSTRIDNVIEIEESTNRYAWKNESERWDTINGKPFATISYDSDSPVSGTSQEGQLFVKFGSTDLPSVKVPIDLMAVITNAVRNNYVIKDNNVDYNSGYYGSYNKKNKTNTNNSATTNKKEENKEIGNLLIGIIGGIDLYPQNITLTIANTAIGTIIRQFYPHNRLLESDIPNAEISAGLSYGPNGINFNAIINNLKLRNLETNKDDRGLDLLLGINNFKITLSENSVPEYVDSSQRLEYSSLDDLKNLFSNINNSRENKYIGINTGIDIQLSAGSNDGNYSTQFGSFLKHVRETIDLFENNRQGTLTESQKELLDNLKEIELSLTMRTNKAIFTRIKVLVAGRVDIAKLMASFDDLKKADQELEESQKTASDYETAADKKIAAMKNIIESLDLAVSIQLFNSKSSLYPSRLLSFYVYGQEKAVYLRLFSSSKTILNNSERDSKIKLDLQNEQLWNLIKKLAFAPNSKKSGGLSTLSNIIPMASGISINETKQLFGDLFNFIKRGDADFSVLFKDKTSLIGLIKEINIKKAGIGVKTTETILNQLLAIMLGSDTKFRLPSVGIGANIGLFNRSGSIISLSAGVEVKDFSDDSLDSATLQPKPGAEPVKLLDVSIQVPRFSLGFTFDATSVTDPRVASLAAYNLLLDNSLLDSYGNPTSNLFGSDFLNGRINEYIEIQDIRSFTLKTNAYLDVQAGTNAINHILNNFGITRDTEFSSESLLSDSEYVDLGISIDLPVGELYNILLTSYNASDYTYDKLLDKDATAKFKNNLVKKIVETTIKNSKILLDVSLKNKDKISGEIKTISKLLNVYYEGEYKENFVFLESDILGLPKNGVKLIGAPSELAKSVINKLTSVLAVKDDATVINKQPEYISVSNSHNIIKLINTMLNKTLNVAAGKKSLAIKALDGTLGLEIKSGILALAMNIAGLDLDGIQLDRLIEGVGISFENDSVNNNYGLSAKVILAGVDSNGRRSTEGNLAIKATIGELFIAASAYPTNLRDTSNATIINLYSSEQQFFEFSTTVNFNARGNLKDINFRPMLSLVSGAVKKLIASENLTSADKLDDLINSVDKIIASDRIDSSLTGKKFLKIKIKVNLQDMFNYYNKRTKNISKLTEGLQIGTPEYEKARLKAKYSTNIEISYLHLDIKLMDEEINGSQNTVFGIVYDSDMLFKDKLGYFDRGNGIIIDTGDKIQKDGKKGLYFNLKSMGINILSIINNSLNKTLNNKLNSIDQAAKRSEDEENANKTKIGQTVSGLTNDDIMSLLDLVASKFANINISDYKSNVERGLESPQGMLGVSTLYINVLDTLTQFSKYITKLTVVDKIKSDLEAKYLDSNGEVKDKYKNEVDKDHLLPKVQLSFSVKTPARHNNETIPFKLEANINLESYKNINGTGQTTNVSLGFGVEDFTLRFSNTKQDIDLSNIIDAEEATLLLQTNLDLMIKSPEHLFEIPVNFNSNSKLAFLQNLIANVQMGPGFSTDETAKHVKLSLIVNLNVGDIISPDRNPQDYKTQILMQLFISGYDKPIKIFTNLNDLYFDLDAIGLPKLKVENIGLLQIIKGIIQSKLDKARLETEESIKSSLNASGNAPAQPVTPPVSQPQQPKEKGNALQIIAAILDSIQNIELVNNSDITFSFKGNLFNSILEQLVGVKGFEDFDSIKLTIANIYGIPVNGTDPASVAVNEENPNQIGLLIRTISAQFEKNLSNNGVNDPNNMFAMSASIGTDDLPTKATFGVFENRDLLEDKDTYISVNELAVKLRAKATIKLTSTDKPFLGLAGLIGLVLDKAGKFTPAYIDNLRKENLYNGSVYDLLKITDALSRAPGETAIEKISNYTGVYSNSTSGSHFDYIVEVNANLPIYEIFTDEELNNDNSKLVLQFSLKEKLNDGTLNNLVNITYSQAKKALVFNSKMIGIEGIQISGFDLLGIIKNIPQIRNFIETNKVLSTENDGATLSSRKVGFRTLEESINNKDKPKFKITLTKEGLEFSINSELVRSALDSISKTLEDKANETGLDSDMEKYKSTKLLLSAVPVIDDIVLKYNRISINNKKGDARMSLNIRQGVGNRHGEMSLDLAIILIDEQGNRFIDYSNKDNSETLFNSTNPIELPKINVPGGSSSNNVNSEINIKNIFNIKNGGNFLVNFPLKKLDVSFSGNIDFSVSSNWKDGPLGKLFELLDKYILKKTTSDSGFVIPVNRSKKYVIKMEGRAIINLETPEGFRNNTGIDVRLSLNNELLAQIKYIAKEEALYLNLENLGLMKVKVTGISLLSMLGSTLFPNNQRFVANYNTVMNPSALKNTEKPYIDRNGTLVMSLNHALASQDVINEYKKIRAEVGIDISEQTIKGRKGTLGTFTLVVNDALIKSILKTVLKTKYNELILLNGDDYNNRNKKFNNENVNNKLETYKTILKLVDELSFNDIKLNYGIFTNPEKNNTGLTSFSIHVNLDRQVNGGRIYTDPDFRFNERNYLDISVDSIRIMEYRDGAINSIIPSTQDKYSSVNISDIKLIVFSKDLSQLKPVAFNIFELLTQQNSGRFIVNGQVHTVPYANNNNSLNITVSRTNTSDKGVVSPLTIRLDGKYDGGNKEFAIIAEAGLKDVLLTVDPVPTTGNGIVDGALKLFLKRKGGLVNNAIEKAIDGLFKVPSEVSSTTTTNPTQTLKPGQYIKDGYLYTRYSEEFNNYMELWANENGKLKTKPYGVYNTYFTRPLNVSEFVSVRALHGNIDGSNMYLTNFDSNCVYLSDSSWLRGFNSYNRLTFADYRQHVKGGSYFMINTRYQAAGLEITTRQYIYDASEITKGLITDNPLKIIKSIKIETDPKIESIRGSEGSYTPNAGRSTAIRVNIDNAIASELINRINTLIYSISGFSKEQIDYLTQFRGGEDSYLSDTKKAIDGFLLSRVYPVLPGILWSLALTQRVASAIQTVTKTLLPLPYPKWLNNSNNVYAKILLESNTGSLLRNIQLKIANSDNTRGWEIILKNNGIRLASLRDTDFISLNGNKSVNIDDIYSKISVSKAYNELLKQLPTTVHATIDNSAFNPSSHDIHIAWIIKDNLLDPLVSSDQDQRNILEYIPFAVNKKLGINGNGRAMIRVPASAVRKPKLENGRYKLYVKLANGSHTVWKDFDYSLLKNIKPGIKEVIKTYISSIKSIAFEMIDANGVPKPGPTTISVNGQSKRVYEFGAVDQLGKKEGKYEFDTLNIPESIEDYMEKVDDSNNLKREYGEQFIYLTYGNNLVKNVKVKIPFTLKKIELDEEALNTAIVEYVKELTTDVKDSTITNDPSLWTPASILKLNSHPFTDGALRLVEKGTNTEAYDSSTYKIEANIQTPIRISVDTINVDYSSGTPIALDPNVDTRIKNIIFALYFPQYRPTRIYMNGILVTIKMTYPNNNGSKIIGVIKMKKEVHFDLYPPYDVSKVKGSLSTSNSNSTSTSNSNSTSTQSLSFVNNNAHRTVASVQLSELASPKIETNDENDDDSIAIGVRYSVPEIKDLISDDENARNILNSDGEVTTFSLFDYDYLISKIRGIDSENILNWIKTFDGDDTFKDKALDEKKTIIDQTFASKQLPFTWKDLVKKIIFRIKASGNSTVSMDTIDNDNSLKVVRFLFTEKANKRKIRLETDNTTLKFGNVNVLMNFNEDRDANSIQNVVKADFKISLPNADLTKEQFNDNNDIDIFYSKKILDIRKNNTEDRAVSWIKSYNGHTITTETDLNNAFKVLGRSVPYTRTADTRNYLGFEFTQEIDGQPLIRKEYELVDGILRFKIFFSKVAESEVKYGTNIRIKLSNKGNSFYGRYNNEDKIIDYARWDNNQMKSTYGNDRNDNFVVSSFVPGKIIIKKGVIDFFDTTIAVKDKQNGSDTLEYYYGINEKDFNNSIRMAVSLYDRYIINLKQIGNIVFNEPINEEKLLSIDSAEIEKYKEKKKIVDTIVGNSFTEKLIIKYFDDGTPETHNLNNGTDHNLMQLTKGADLKIHFVKATEIPLNFNSAMAIKEGDYLFNKNTIDIDAIKTNIAKIQFTAKVGKKNVELVVVSDASKEDLSVEYENVNVKVVVIDKHNDPNFRYEFKFSDLGTRLDELGNYALGEYVLDNANGIIVNLKLPDGTYSGDNLRDNFNIKVYRNKKDKKPIEDENLSNELKFNILPKNINIDIDKQDFTIAYKQQKAIIKAPKLDNNFVKLKNNDISLALTNNNGTLMLTNLIPGTYQEGEDGLSIGLIGELELNPIYLEKVSNPSVFVANHYKFSLKFKDDATTANRIIVKPRLVTVNYQDISGVYSNRELLISEIIANVVDLDDLLTDDFLSRIYDDYMLSIDGKEFKNISYYLSDKKDQSGNYLKIVKSIRFVNLGAGDHSLRLKAKDNAYFVFNDDSKQSNVYIAKKKIRFGIGTQLKYYKQDIDEELIPLVKINDLNNKTDMPFDGFVSWKEYTLNKDGVPVPSSTHIDTVSSLELEYQWVESIGQQKIIIKNANSHNYDFNLAEINSKWAGIMNIKKTKIRIYFAKPLKKFVEAEDPYINIADFIFIDPALDTDDDAEYKALFNSGIYEAEINDTVITGNFGRQAGEKVGEYKYNNGTIKLSYPDQYELEFIELTGKDKEIKYKVHDPKTNKMVEKTIKVKDYKVLNNISESKNAKLIIEKKPKTIPASTARPLLITFFIIVIILLIVAIVLFILAARLKHIRKINSRRRELEGEK